MVDAPSFLGKYDTPIRLYVMRRLREREYERAVAERAAARQIAAVTEGIDLAAWEAEFPVPQPPEPADDDLTWWVDYRPTLTGRMLDSLRSRFCHVEERGGRAMIITDDYLGNIREQTLMLIKGWNLTGLDGEVMPCDFDWESELVKGAPPSGLRVSWELLPSHIRQLISDEIGESEAEPDPAKDKRFPPGGGSGAPVRDDEASDDREGMAGAGVP